MVKVDLKGLGANTVSLVKKAIDMKEKAKKDKEPYNQVWVVFDKDDFSLDSFNKAFEIAEKDNIKVAYSNQSFELWYVLHFNFHQAALHREVYCKKLCELMNQKYDKTDKLMYKNLLDKQNTAIKNAKKLLQDKGYKNDPSTTVYKLVEELNKHIKNK